MRSSTIADLGGVDAGRLHLLSTNSHLRSLADLSTGSCNGDYDWELLAGLISGLHIIDRHEPVGRLILMRAGRPSTGLSRLDRDAGQAVHAPRIAAVPAAGNFPPPRQCRTGMTAHSPLLRGRTGLPGGGGLTPHGDYMPHTVHGAHV
jgi:hypothetical protein